jgi:hypothetical protein
MVDFSHKYYKMPEGWQLSRLLQVFQLDRQDLSHEFEMYDTHIEGGGHYELPNGPLLVLLLLTEDKEELWTTIRRCTPSKLNWYKGLVGYIIPMRMIPKAQKKLANIYPSDRDSKTYGQPKTMTEHRTKSEKIENLLQFKEPAQPSAIYSGWRWPSSRSPEQ